jgi:dUTP pyrophosphatase
VFAIDYCFTEPGGKEPLKATPGANGFDLVAVSVEKERDGLWTYDTGVAFAIPEGWVGLVFARSSIAKQGAALANSVGVIDTDYRGAVKLKFYAGRQPYAVGDRVGQIVFLPAPKVELVYTPDLPETQRGAGGFGSTGQ